MAEPGSAGWVPPGGPFTTFLKQITIGVRRECSMRGWATTFEPSRGSAFWSRPSSGRVHTALGGVVGALYALVALDPRFLLGLGPRWACPTPDLSAYLVSAQYYLRD